jgi:hypothetical protein
MRFDIESLTPLAAVVIAVWVSRGSLARRWPPLAALGRPAILLSMSALLTAALWVFEARTDLLPLLYAAAYLLASRGWETVALPPAVDRALSSRAAPLVAASATCLLALLVWGGLHPRPIIQDEAAYLLQARLFAQGRWADPPPPLPEFFEQGHVLVEPRRAAKYPPGHALALTPGVAVGVPALMPLLLTGATGGMLFALARRVAGAPAAALSWLIWLASPLGLRYRSSFFSEVTTGLLWLVAWAAVDRWRRGGRSGWLVAAGAAAGLGAITRPLTMLLFTVPLGIWILREAARRRSALAPAGAVVAGLLVLGLLPLWSLRTTGDLRTSPLTLYTRQYLPFDVPGFGLRQQEPARELPADVQWLSKFFSRIHALHVPGQLPRILAERAAEVFRGAFGAGLFLLLPATLVGLFFLPREGLFVVATGVLLLVGYLVYAHHASWSIYYFEALAPLSLAAGAGLTGMIRGLPPRFRLAGATLAACSLVFLIGKGTLEEREIKRHQEDPFRRFEERIATIEEPRAIVFVRYAPNHNAHLSLITNPPGLAASRRWIVYDRGADNARLLAIDPSRAAYLYDEETGRLWPLATAPPAPALIIPAS